jgi:hypothetical protein
MTTNAAASNRRHPPGVQARRASCRRRVGQAQPCSGRRVVAQRLLRPASAAELPTSQRLPDLSRLPDHAAVPAAASRQRDDTLVLLTAVEQAGNTRLAANHRQVVGDLGNVIDTLEAIEQESADAR